MKITVELPENTTCVSLSYIFEDEDRENMLIGTGVITRDDLISGHFECKGSVQNAKD